MKYRIALDTNVLFSGLYFGGKPGQIIELVVHRQADLIISEYIRDEYLHVAKMKGLPDESFRKLLELDNVRLVADQDYSEGKSLRKASFVCRHANDVPILAFALHGFENNWMDYLVTGDKDLLTAEISTATKNRIRTPVEFIELHQEKKD